MKSGLIRFCSSVSVAAILSAVSASAAVAAENPALVEEVIVTAQKRAENLQNVPASVSAVTGDALRQQQISSVEGLAQSLPNVNFGQTTGNARIAIRGVGFDNISLGNEGRIAYHVDGVYVSRPAAALATFYDVERVEVLRGPQGTLYGRNATGGAVNLVSRAPTRDFGGYLDGTVGNYGLYKAEGALSGPLSDAVSGRVAFQVVERGGYGKNVTTGEDVDDQSTRAIRAQLRLEPTPQVQLTLSGDYFTEDDHAYSFHFLGQGSLPNPTSTPALPGIVPKGLLIGGGVTANKRDSAADSGPSNSREFWGLGANLHATLGAVELNAVTGYRSSDFKTTTDLDATSARLTIYDQLENSTQFSQELRLSGDFRRAEWVIGGYYFKESLFGGTRVALDPAVLGPPRPTTGLKQGFFGLGSIDTDAYALFGRLRLHLSDQVAVNFGARYSDERKEIDEENKLDLTTAYPPFVPVYPPTPPGVRRQTSASWTSFTPSVTVEFKPTQDLLLYATYSKGFKSGGFNLGNVQPPFAPEKITDYEVGLRADWLEGRLRTNLSAFNYDYTDLQVSKVNGTVISIENAANAKVRGLEAEVLLRPTEPLRLEANFALLDSEYENYVSSDPARAALGPIDLSGNDLTQAPRYTVNLNASYRWDTALGTITARGEARWVDRVFFTQYNLAHISQPAYELFNAFLTWESADRGWTASAYVRNIADKEIISSGLVSSTLVGAPFVGSLEPPRTYGLTVGRRF